jgi:hypothetical protein
LTAETLRISELITDVESLPVQATPGLTHTRVLIWLDKTGLPPWVLGFSCFIAMSITAIVTLIFARVPDPDIYRNSVAFVAIISFFLGFYFRMGRGWYQDVLKFLEFDSKLESSLGLMEPGRMIVWFEIAAAVVSAAVNLFFTRDSLPVSTTFMFSIFFFYIIYYATILFSIDITFRQVAELVQIAKKVRIDLLETDFYSTLANPMLRFVGLYIFGLCVITMSFLVFTEGEYGTGQMMLIMMPWYLPGLVLMSLYMIPYNIFSKRMKVVKTLELNKVSSALKGSRESLKDSLIGPDRANLTMVDLLYYQVRIKSVREWPFTDRLRALVLFGILPPLTWVIAAFIEITIESAL